MGRCMPSFQKPKNAKDIQLVCMEQAKNLRKSIAFAWEAYKHQKALRTFNVLHKTNQQPKEKHMFLHEKL